MFTAGIWGRSGRAVPGADALRARATGACALRARSTGGCANRARRECAKRAVLLGARCDVLDR